MRRIATCAVLFLVPALGVTSASAGVPRHVRDWQRAHDILIHAHAPQLSASAAGTVSSDVVAENFDVIGQADLGLIDTNADVWVHGDTAYVGTWEIPCDAAGVKIVDVTDPASPTQIGNLAQIPGTSAEDIVVRSVSTAWFEGDLLATGIQRCDYEDRSLDDDKFGFDLWDVTDPASPVHLAYMGISHGGGGVHEIDLFERGNKVFVAAAVPFSEPFEGRGDFFIADVSDPYHPNVVGQWGALANGLVPSPFIGLGNGPLDFAHSARANLDGTLAFVSYWDLGVISLDITDPHDPVMVGRTLYPVGSEGEAHSVAEVFTPGGGHYLLQNDEDFDPLSPVLVGAGGAIGAGAEPGFGPPRVWKLPGHELAGRVARPLHQCCTPSDYTGHPGGRIAVPRTIVSHFADRLCSQARQENVAEEVGAAAVLHDWVSNETGPIPFLADVDLGIPVVLADHSIAREAVEAGHVRLIGQPPSWGFIRVFDADTGEQVAKFDAAGYVHSGLRGPVGFWSVHNNEVWGDRDYAAWYTDGVVALDIGTLDGAPPGDPVLVGRFVPEGGPSHVPGFIPDGVPVVWGVVVRPSDGLLFVSDVNSGLWIVEPTGPAAPSP